MGLKSIFHSGKVYHAIGMFQPIGYERYLALSLLVPVNLVYQIPKSKWSLAAGPALGCHNFKYWGTASDYLKETYNYNKIRITKEIVCAGYQLAMYYKKTDILSFFGEYSWSKSGARKLASLGLGIRYFI